MGTIEFHSYIKGVKVCLVVANISEIYPSDSGKGVRIHMNNGHYYTTEDVTFAQCIKIIEGVKQ